jgi:hypothetical protein
MPHVWGLRPHGCGILSLELIVDTTSIVRGSVNGRLIEDVSVI